MAHDAPPNPDYIAGLLLERAGAVQSKNKDHLAQIDAELKRVGYSEGDAVKSKSVHYLELETATVEPVTEKATVHRAKAKAAKAAPVVAPAKPEPTPEPEPLPSPFGTFGQPKSDAGR